MFDGAIIQTAVNYINSVLDPIGIVIGLIISVPIFWTWYDVVWGRQRRMEKWRKNASSYTGQLKGVLIIDLLVGTDMLSQVNRFIESKKDEFGEIPTERRLHVNWQAEMTPYNASEIAKAIQEKISIVSIQGIDELHVFYGGPGSAAAILGAELSNSGCKVLLYQNDRNTKSYVNFGPLRYPRYG